MATRIGFSREVQPRIIVDCTHTFHTGAGTGIQRVVRHYSAALLEVALQAQLQIVPVRVADGQFIPLPMVNGRIAFPRSKSAREPESAASSRKSLQVLRGLGYRLNRLLRSGCFEAWLAAGPNDNGLERHLNRLTSTPKHEDALRISPSDILLSLDSSWVYDIRTALDAAGREGATRVAVLCDVLPLTQPQWFTEGTRRYFKGWLKAMLPRLEGVVAISEATCTELRELVAAGRLGARKMPHCCAVHLGAEVAGDEEATIRASLRDLLGADRAPALLTVGTIEPRKNVGFALDLFDELLVRGMDIQWHIIGAAGWLMEKTEHRIRGHPEYGARLHWWTDLNDGELTWCYRKAAALVAVSKAEGFGLPLVEARLQGLPVFASDIPVFREVLGSEGRYLPLSNARLGAAALGDFLVRSFPGGKSRVPSRIARSWQDAARELLDTLLRISRGNTTP
jgi:glycosyltransferase involved in cell wall biosynthesis